MSFFSKYLLATSNNESPLSFHKWSCLSALSVLAGRRFWFNLGPFTYYPNFYVVLVGDPGVKKSAAMDVAKNLIRKVGGVPMAASSTTKEAICKEMGNEKYPGKKFFKNDKTGRLEEYNQLAIFATEFTTFLGVNPEGMIDFLTGIYTEQVFDERYKNAGSSIFIGPYITMLACMTPQTVKGYLKQEILTGGFSRRTMFVFGTRGIPNPWPGNTPEQQAAMQWCIDWGKEVQQRHGEFFLDDSGKHWYESWYIDNASKVLDRKPNVQAYYSTKFEFLFKTAMLFSLSEGDDMLITGQQLEFLNKNFFEPVEETLERVFEGSGINPNAQVAAQVCHMLEALNKPMARKQVEGMFYDNASSLNELRDALNHLVSVGRLDEKAITVNGVLLGNVIASRGCLARYSDADLASILKPDLRQLRS